MSETTERNHARENAAAWMSSVAQMVAALEVDYDRLAELREQDERDEAEAEEFRELTEAATVDGDLMEDREEAERRITEAPLSVQVRSGWVDPGAEMTAEEFEVLLTTGGPALRIRGELDSGQPHRAWLEYQDWGTAWTEYHGENADQATLLAFCQQFYFGE